MQDYIKLIKLREYLTLYVALNRSLFIRIRNYILPPKHLHITTIIPAIPHVVFMALYYTQTMLNIAKSNVINTLNHNICYQTLRIRMLYFKYHL